VAMAKIDESKRNLEGGVLRRLGELAVLWVCHLPSKFRQDGLQRVRPLPAREALQPGPLDLPVLLVHARQIDSRQERDDGWRIRVVLVTENLQTVDAVLVDGVPGSDDRAIPRAQRDVLTIGKTIAASAIADALLTLLKFFEESEVARDFGHSGW